MKKNCKSFGSFGYEFVLSDSDCLTDSWQNTRIRNPMLYSFLYNKEKNPDILATAYGIYWGWFARSSIVMATKPDGSQGPP